MQNEKWARLLAYVSGLVNQRLLLQCEYLAARIASYVPTSRRACGCRNRSYAIRRGRYHPHRLHTGKLLVAGRNGASDTLNLASPKLNLASPKLNLAPRLGLSYALGDKTVIRSGIR